MKILVATDIRFWRRALGSHQRVYSLLEFLHAEGHAIEVLFIGALTAEDETKARVLNFAKLRATLPPLDEHTASAPPRKNFTRAVLREILQLFRRLPAELVYFAKTRKLGISLRFDLGLREPKLRDFIRPAAVEQLNELLEQEQPDVLLIEYLRLSYFVPEIPPSIRQRLRILVDTHDVQFERRARFHGAGLAHDIDVTAAEEAARLAWFDAVIAIQPRDAASFRQLVRSRPVIVAGHPQHISGTGRAANEGRRFLFLGSDMAPNIEAAKRLAFRIWPEISQRLNGAASLSIAGRVGAALAGQALPRGITLTGHVESLEETYCTHDISLNPVDFGGGLKIKNVEALAYGLALVTTAVGAEGLENAAGEAFLVAQDDREFIETAVKLATDDALRAALSRNALAYSREHLGPRSSYRELTEYLNGFPRRAGAPAA